MRIVVFGATGNVGSSLVEILSDDDRVESVRGLARRVPDRPYPKTEFVAVDIAQDDLRGHVRGADVVVHLTWAIQPMRDPRATWNVNVLGLHRLIDAVSDERCPALVYVSSIGAYAPRDPKAPDEPRDESYPTTGLGGTQYAMEKAYDERLLDGFEHAAPWCRVVRIRPAIVVKETAGREIARLFLGPLGPPALSAIRRLGLPVPLPVDMRLQLVHSYDVARALQAACHRSVRGPFNLAAEPVVRREDIVHALGASTPIGIPWTVLKAVVSAGFRSRFVSLEPGWIDLTRLAPLLDTARAHAELDWQPRHDAIECLNDALSGVRRSIPGPTPPLAA
jgi:UDP-glucose 4-epimerase